MTPGAWVHWWEIGSAERMAAKPPSGVAERHSGYSETTTLGREAVRHDRIPADPSSRRRQRRDRQLPSAADRRGPRAAHRLRALPGPGRRPRRRLRAAPGALPRGGRAGPGGHPRAYRSYRPAALPAGGGVARADFLLGALGPAAAPGGGGCPEFRLHPGPGADRALSRRGGGAPCSAALPHLAHPGGRCPPPGAPAPEARRAYPRLGLCGGGPARARERPGRAGALLRRPGRPLFAAAAGAQAAVALRHPGAGEHLR